MMVYITAIRRNKRETVISLTSGVMPKDKFRLKYILKHPERVEKLYKLEKGEINGRD